MNRCPIPPRSHPPRKLARAARKAFAIATLCALSAIASLPIGCGGTQARPAARASSAAPQTARNLQSHLLSRAAALAFAYAVNLNAADIPEASISHRSARADPAERRELHRCEGHNADTRALARVDSPKFTRGQELETEEIRSGVTVLASRHDVARELTAWAARPVRECVAHTLDRYFSERTIRNARWGHVSVSSLPVQAPGADATVGIRVGVTLTGQYSEVTVPFYVDYLGFAWGHALVGVMVVSVTQPVPALTEHQLLALLLSRARAHAA